MQCKLTGDHSRGEKQEHELLPLRNVYEKTRAARRAAAAGEGAQGRAFSEMQQLLQAQIDRKKQTSV